MSRLNDVPDGWKCCDCKHAHESITNTGYNVKGTNARTMCNERALVVSVKKDMIVKCNKFVNQPLNNE